jgi:hypothetical protein
LIKSSSATSIEPAFNQTSTGSTTVESGSLGFASAATSAGTVTLDPGTSLGVGSFTQTAGSTILNGASINGGSLSINGQVPQHPERFTSRQS